MLHLDMYDWISDISCLILVFVFLKVRGSIPLLWEQIVDLTYKPKFELVKLEEAVSLWLLFFTHLFDSTSTAFYLYLAADALNFYAAQSGRATFSGFKKEIWGCFSCWSCQQGASFSSSFFKWDFIYSTLESIKLFTFICISYQKPIETILVFLILLGNSLSWHFLYLISMEVRDACVKNLQVPCNISVVMTWGRISFPPLLKNIS